jgi:hypothetical protein
MDPEETYNPWSIVNLVFRHLADEGLHPVLGESGDPGPPAAALLAALGVTPSSDGNKKITTKVSDELAQLREAYEATHPDSRGTTPVPPHPDSRGTTPVPPHPVSG